mmetsp:Transcript_124739/g.398739  ORF Transcript_124739/g.398739 Transcript_124739/m.398739 type:complete len:312 (+) Transcript_124739:589-1524(+)
MPGHHHAVLRVLRMPVLQVLCPAILHTGVRLRNHHTEVHGSGAQALDTIGPHLGAMVDLNLDPPPHGLVMEKAVKAGGDAGIGLHEGRAPPRRDLNNSAWSFNKARTGTGVRRRLSATPAIGRRCADNLGGSGTGGRGRTSGFGLLLGGRALSCGEIENHSLVILAELCERSSNFSLSHRIGELGKLAVVSENVGRGCTLLGRRPRQCGRFLRFRRGRGRRSLRRACHQLAVLPWRTGAGKGRRGGLRLRVVADVASLGAALRLRRCRVCGHSCSIRRGLRRARWWGRHGAGRGPLWRQSCRLGHSRVLLG